MPSDPAADAARKCLVSGDLLSCPAQTECLLMSALTNRWGEFLNEASEVEYRRLEAIHLEAHLKERQ